MLDGVLSREGRCRRVARQRGWSVLVRRSVPGLYGLRQPHSRCRIDLDITALDAALGIGPVPTSAPTWMALAACRGVDPETFYPPRGDRAAVQRARKVCRRCPVAVECLAFAVERRDPFGVWGGTTRNERVALRRESAH